ncbi:hypothetical protein [Pseudomonas sp. TE50-2]|uniref:hypothetical protein n=1 Tax=Pseudomonas sp. TE50-2 TaxID=3142707 RepID=UPI0034658F27
MIVHIEVVVHKTDAGWEPLDNPRRLFPKMGEVEMRSLDSMPLRQGEWAAFQVVPSDRRGQWRAASPRRLYAYQDLSQAQSLEEVRRILTIEGLPANNVPGIWMVRTPDEQVIQVELVRSSESTLVLSKNTILPAYGFDVDAVESIPTGTAEEIRYELEPDTPPCHTYDWTPEKGYIERVARWISGANSPQMTQVATWLQQHADEKTGHVAANPSDALAFQHALRSGELAKRLATDQTMLRNLANALASDSKIAGLIEREMKAIAEEERKTIRAQLETQLTEEGKSRRKLRTAEIDTELKAYEASQLAEVAQRLERGRREGEEALTAYQSAQKAEAERVLGEQLASLEQKKTVLEQACSDLSQSRNELCSELEALEAQAADLKTLVADLEAHKAKWTLELEGLNAAVAAASERLEFASTSVVPLRRPDTAKVWSSPEAGQIIKDCPLLTGNGQRLMEQFLALVLAGETPLLVGPDVEDFLLIAESLIASGRSARLKADPTILTFEDLWIRAGTGLRTPLAQGLALATAAEPCSILAVVEHVERSGARFWLPALTDRARRGDLPRRLFLCATVEDADCEEAEALRAGQIWLPIKDAIAKEAITIAPLWLSSVHRGELDPGKRPDESIESDLNVAHQLANRLGLINTLRGVRAAAEVATFHTGKGATEAIARMVTLFLHTAGANQSAGSTH